MRKLLKIGGLLMGLLMSLAAPLLAQRTVSDATITYKIELPPEQLQMDALLAGSSMIQYVRGNHSRVDVNFNVVNYIYITDLREQTMITLMDNHGDKYLIRSDKKAYEAEMKKYEGTQFTDQNEVREIAGYKCRKAIAKMNDGSTFEVFYTIDLVPENAGYNRRFVNLKGIPLEFEIVMKTGFKMKMVATKVDLSPVPASVFDVPRGYKEITEEELKKIRG